MRRTIIHSIHLLAAFLLMVTVSGCVEPISPDQPVAPGARTLTLQIALPSATSLLTKAGTDPSTIVGPNDERKVTSLQIWAFKHGAGDGEIALVYLPNTDTPLTDVLSNNPMEFTMTLPDDVMDAVRLDVPFSLDFYVLANGTSFGLGQESSLQAVRDAVITGFGSGTSMVTSVPDAGLPMSVSLENFDVTFLLYSLTNDQLKYIKENDPRALPASNPVKDEKQVFSDEQWNFLSKKLFFADSKWDYSKVCVLLDLSRAVSKIRFVFAKATSMTDATTINTIKLVKRDDSQEEEFVLPKSTYLFAKKDGSKPGDDYEAFSWDNVQVNFTGKTVDTPLRLRKDSSIESEIESGGTKKAPKDMSLEDYSTFLTTEITAGHALEKILYLRESDKTGINVKINYTIGTGDDAVTADAYIPLNTSFTRNTWWTVYTYFMSYELGFQVTVLPWNGVESNSQLE